MSKNKSLNPVTMTWEDLQRQDNAAREAGVLVGRYLAPAYADGRAFYVITRENKKTVVVKHVIVANTDGWRLPAWGDESRVDIDMVRRDLKSRDFFALKQREQQASQERVGA